MPQPCGQLGIGARGSPDDKGLQGLATFKHIQHILTFPANLADHDQARRLVFQPLGQLAPHMQNQPMIFPRLDSTQHDEVRVLQRRLRIAGRQMCL
ncbi:MAG: hypothetical protein JW395_1332 [Nitrospira sp.]|nr:hypothetical protein [Nitrospira sp.]